MAKSVKRRFYASLIKANDSQIQRALDWVEDQEAGAVLDSMGEPARFVYVEDRITETVVREIMLPGVTFDVEVENPADEELELGRFTLLEHDERGMVFPVGTRHVVEWARERRLAVADWSERVWEELAEDGRRIPVGLGAVWAWSCQRISGTD